MKISEAKVGMKVVGNRKASKYFYTHPGVECKIVNVCGNLIDVEIDNVSYKVDPECFDIVDEYKEFNISAKMLRDMLDCPKDKAIYIKDDVYSPYIITDNYVLDNEGDKYSFVSFLIDWLNDNEYKLDDITVEEMTLEEVCEALGKNIKIVKGETK